MIEDYKDMVITSEEICPICKTKLGSWNINDDPIGWYCGQCKFKFKRDRSVPIDIEMTLDGIPVIAIGL